MDEFDEEFDDEEFETITMQDEEGNDVEFLVVDAVIHEDVSYLLVIDSGSAEDEAVEAVILKEVNRDDEESFYEMLEEGQEFNVVSSLFQNNENYEIEL